MDVKKQAQSQAEEAYSMFLAFCKWFSYFCLLLLIALTTCSFGVDGTGGKGNPDLYKEYKERMGLNGTKN